MSDDRAFRILVGYNPDKERYWARVPELTIEAEGASRAEAITAAEKQIESQIEDAATKGGKISAPVDTAIEAGAITLQLAGPVRRDLEYQARLANLTPEALAMQLLARALGSPVERSAPRPRSEPVEDRGPREGNSRDGNNRGNTRDGNTRDGNAPDRGPPRQNQGRGRQREGYRPELDNQADFLAYVRDSEKGRGGRR